MKKPKLIQISKFHHPYPRGMETYLYDLCNAFKDKFSLKVLVANDKLKTVLEEVDGVKIAGVVSFGEMFSSFNLISAAYKAYRTAKDQYLRCLALGVHIQRYL